MGRQGPVGIFLDAKPRPGRVADDPDHPDRVLDEFFLRVPDAADDPLAKVFQPSHVIHQGEIGDIVEDAIDGDIPAESVLDGGSEGIVRMRRNFLAGLVEFRTPPEGGHLDILSPGEVDVGQAEAVSDESGIAEEVPDLTRVGIGGDVEIFGGLAQKQIADAPTHQVCRETMMVEPVKDLQSIRVDGLAGDGVLLAGENAGGDGFIHGIDSRPSEVCRF